MPHTDLSTLDPLLERMGKLRVLVLGDMGADEYLTGRPDRISREAPVLILTYTGSFVRPGGAANAAYNLRTLGATTRVVGVIGDDAMGRRLSSVLHELGIETSGLCVDPSRPTSTKTRILAKGTQEAQQQIVRIDRVDESMVDGSLRDRTIDATRRALREVDALLISDYENGVIGSEVIEACLPAARTCNVPIFVDSHGDLMRFKGITAATPNQPEAEGTLGRRFRGEEDLTAAGRELLEGMEARGVLITRGSEGIALFERDAEPYLLPVALRNENEVVDPNGAGDTVAAVFTLAVTAGASMRTAAFLGDVAGGEAVRRLGAVGLTREDLRAALRRTHLAPPDGLR
jgi:D-glycero-beta-D-manno-heptose-7-phosphate kinase